MNCIPTDEDLTILIKEISKPKVQRHVRFASNNTVHMTSAIDNNTEEQWYQKDEIASFKLYIQNLTASLIRGEKLKVDTTETFRGLEHYCDLNRLKRKQNVISFILKAQMLAKGSQLASIAHDCTSWHRDISFVQGLHDYCDVYNPAMARSMPPPPSTSDFHIIQESVPKRRCAPSILPHSPKRLRTAEWPAKPDLWFGAIWRMTLVYALANKSFKHLVSWLAYPERPFWPRKGFGYMECVS